MSGGHFDYKQYDLAYIADAIEHIIITNGKPKRPDDMYSWDEEGSVYYLYEPKVIQHFQEAVLALRIAQAYAHRVDWLVSADDGPDSFLRRLEEDLKEIKRKYTPEYFEKLKKMSMDDYDSED